MGDTWTDVLLTVITVIIVLVSIQLIRTLKRIGSLASGLEQTTGPLGPRLEGLLEETAELLKAARGILQRVESVAGNATSISAEATQIVVPLIRDMSVLREVSHRLSAMTVAVGTAFRAFSNRTEHVRIGS